MKVLCLLLTVLMFLSPTSFSRAEQKTSSDDVIVTADLTEVIAPYLEVVSRINQKYGVNIVVPPNSVLDILYCIKDKTPEEFEMELDELCKPGENGVAPFAKNEEIHLIYVLLLPYQAVIDKLNDELGTRLMITDSGKYDVYKNSRSKTPEEVESLLRKQIENDK